MSSKGGRRGGDSSGGEAKERHNDETLAPAESKVSIDGKFVF